MLKKILKDTFTPDESENTISSFDQIGDIIIVRIPDSLLSKKNLIGETLLNEVKIARSVFYQASPVEGDFRIRNLELIAGENKTRTQYKEFGIKFCVDVEKAFFSPRLSNERERISNLVQAGEIVVNMFGGIGMFSIMIAKRKKCTVYSIDINPFAVKLCEENITLNKLEGEIISIQGDASQIIASRLENKSDRTLMLLPEKSDEFLKDAILTTKNGGIIHY
jgi:tRNA (guanine37-N1)-methyltransferase